MNIDPIRMYLLGGLMAHKLIWEILKRRAAADCGRLVQPFQVKLVKVGKILILGGVLAQTVMPDVLPIAANTAILRTGGALVFTAGLAVAVLGRIQLGDNWLDIELAGVKHTQTVVSKGVYGFIRHPIYVGDLALLCGLELALNSWLFLCVAVLAPVVLRQAVAEERMLVQSLPGYALYCQRTKRFLPFVA